ncbi:MAG TPA: 50S ribosomal protein L18 [Dehalococcoidales bacterium]|nr:50S ribosomal protein L18 [Dehalococcoidales bacterium]
MSKNTKEARERRHVRVRQKIAGSAERPRLAIFRSLSNIYAQVIDDNKGNTLVSASTLDAELKKETKGKKKTGRAEQVGILVAKRAAEKGIKQVTFDRGGFKYQGRVKALADAARKGGLKF